MSEASSSTCREQPAVCRLSQTKAKHAGCSVPSVSDQSKTCRLQCAVCLRPKQNMQAAVCRLSQTKANMQAAVCRLSQTKAKHAGCSVPSVSDQSKHAGCSVPSVSDQSKTCRLQCAVCLRPKQNMQAAVCRLSQTKAKHAGCSVPSVSDQSKTRRLSWFSCELLLMTWFTSDVMCHVLSSNHLFILICSFTIIVLDSLILLICSFLQRSNKHLSRTVSMSWLHYIVDTHTHAHTHTHTRARARTYAH